MTSSPPAGESSRKRPRTDSIDEIADALQPAKRGTSTEKDLRVGLSNPDEDIDNNIDNDNDNDEGPDVQMADAELVERGNGADAAGTTTALQSQGTLPLSPPMPPPKPSPRQKWDQISRLELTTMNEGDTWYLVAADWYNKWKDACDPASKSATTDDADKALGPIDNASILKDGNLVPAVSSESVVHLPPAAWSLLVEWYGAPDPTTILPRKVISEGQSKQKRIEYYPYTIKCYRMSQIQTSLSASSPTPTISISKAATIQDLIDSVKKLHPVTSSTNHRFWHVNAQSFDLKPAESTFYPASRVEMDGAELISTQDSELDKRIDDYGIDNNDAVVIELQHGSWLADYPTRSSTLRASSNRVSDEVYSSPFSSQNNHFGYGSSFANRSYMSNNNAIGSSARSGYNSFSSSYNSRSTFGMNRISSPGAVGLNNLGNTCFMNSALQCLAHTPELTEYFLVGVFRDELNHDNPLGMGGAIAEVYDVLLDRVWNPTNYAYAPREFKQVLQKFAPQFSGYAQHDTQEFLAFLLDGLHEDLNRVLKKPYVELPDWNGGGLKDLVQHAKTAWEGYKKRNDSVIVDLFQGQYKSTLVCPECQKVSITFDPLMYLTLPLPIKQYWRHDVLFVPWDLNKPHLKIPVELSRDASCKDVKNLLKKWLDVSVENLMFVEIFAHKIFKYWSDHTPVTEIGDKDIVVMYELPGPSGQGQTKVDETSPYVPIAVYHGTPGQLTYSRLEYKGIPFFIAVPSEEITSEDAIYARIVERYTRWTQRREMLYKRQATKPATPTYKADTPQSMDVEEKDIAEMDADEDQDASNSLPKQPDTPSSNSSEPEVTNLGPQLSLFNIKAYHSSVDSTVAFRFDPLNGTPETLAQRAKSGLPSKRKSSWKWRAATPERSKTPDGRKPLLSPDDTLVCEWDSNLYELFFPGVEIKRGVVSPQPPVAKEEAALWDVWSTFEHPEYTAAQATRKSTKSQGISLEDCLDEFTKEEMLGEDDLWYCPRCKKHQQATKKIELWKIPDILVVHLKRFSNSRLLRDKIDAFVDFPIDALDLTDRVGERQAIKQWAESGNAPEALGLDASDQEPLLYDLFAVDEHMGGLGGGHYRAYAKNFDDDKWYHFDDTHVSLSTARQAVNQNAYVLFYRRRTDQPLGGETQVKVALAKQNPNRTKEEPKSQDQSISRTDYYGINSINDDEEGPFRSTFRGTPSPEFGPHLPNELPGFDDSIHDTIINLDEGPSGTALTTSAIARWDDEALGATRESSPANSSIQAASAKSSPQPGPGPYPSESQDWTLVEDDTEHAITQSAVSADVEEFTRIDEDGDSDVLPAKVGSAVIHKALTLSPPDVMSPDGRSVTGVPPTPPLSAGNLRESAPSPESESDSPPPLESLK